MTLKPGAKYKILQGNFEGFEAEVVSVAQDHINASFMMFGKLVTVELSYADVGIEVHSPRAITSADEIHFLTVLRQSSDDDARLIYADWLEERGHNLEASYLRVETELRNTWTWQDQRPDLRNEIREMRVNLDSEWLSRVRRCKTPPPPFRLEDYFPELSETVKPAILLHPRPGKPMSHESSIGGAILWPKDEPHPTCSVHEDCRLTPALQIHKRDLPAGYEGAISFKDQTDLLQVLWCPQDHDLDYDLHPRLYWRNADQLDGVLEPKTIDEFGLVPRPCILIPEMVNEYPDPIEVELAVEQFEREDFQNAVRNIPLFADEPWTVATDAGYAFQTYLSSAPGTKIGGHPSWVQDEAYPTCGNCGALSQHFLTFSNSEYDGVSWGRWLPMEERDTLTSPYSVRSEVQSPADWSFGDGARLYLFLCERCDDAEVQWESQSC